MILLDRIEVSRTGGAGTIELWQGDLTEPADDERLDLLVVSAFPDDYAPLPDTLIGALAKRGVSVAALAERKAEDLRANFSCWISEVLPQSVNVPYGRILCFEPDERGRAAELVGGIFRSLAPFVAGPDAIRTVAMPVVSTGDVGESIDDVLPALVATATEWLLAGLPLDRLKIVERSPQKAEALAALFANERERLVKTAGETSPDSREEYDVFISYCQQNASAVDLFVEHLRASDPELRVFRDIQEIDVGVAWQQAIYDAIEDCRKIVALYTPEYLASKMCQEEYNIARLREREEGGVLVPIYFMEADLPNYYRITNYVDCREADQEQLQKAAADLAGAIGRG